MKQFFRENALSMATVTSVILGVVVGVLCRNLNPSPDTILLVGFPGELFLRMLKMLMIPLIVASMISGIGSLKGASAGRMGVVSLLYYAVSSLMALLMAMALGMTIKPGSQSHDVTPSRDIEDFDKMSGLDMFLDLLRSLVPDNIVGATLQHTKTVPILSDDDSETMNVSGKHKNTSLEDGYDGEHMSVTKKIRLFDGSNLIGLLLYCVVFGIILSRQGRQGLVISKLFAGLNVITLQMIQLVMWEVDPYSPVGILFLIASSVMSSKDLLTTGHTLGIYVAAEISGLAVHMLISLPLFYFLLTRRNAFTVYIGALQALFTALATSSSAATLPVTLRCVEDTLKMDSRVSGFVLPIGTTVNMDGTAVYFVIAPLFIAQYNAVSLSFTDILIISVTSMFSSVGSAALPGSIPVLLLALSVIGLPDRGISFLLTVDWLMDRFRTLVNVASDCLAVGVTACFAALPVQRMNEPSRIKSQDFPLPAQELQETSMTPSDSNHLQSDDFNVLMIHASEDDES